MALAPVSGATSTPSSSSSTATQDAATNAFGLSFESLLKIIMTQLSYQDPLKPMDNFEFVSQLAQFAQIQIGQNGNDKLAQVAASQATLQATSLLGRTVNVNGGSGGGVIGKVTEVKFTGSGPTIGIQLSGGQTISDIPISSISQVTEGNP